MNKKWMPITAGILDIIGGFLGGGNANQASCVYYMTREADFDTLDTYITYYNAVSLLALVCLALAIVGAVCAFIRKKWPIALAGAIAALLPSILAMVYYFLTFGPRYYPLALYLIGAGIAGIAAITLTVLSRKQFKSKKTESGA